MGSDTERCPRCGNEYKKLGSHWVRNANCSHPDPNDLQKGVIRYLHEKKGFGTVEAEGQNRNPKLWFWSSSTKTLEEIDDHLGWLSCGVISMCGPTDRLVTRSLPWLRRFVEVSDDG